MNFKELICHLHEIHLHLQQEAIRAVNTSLTFRNWFFGYYIFEFEQKGSDRAAYGEKLLFNISKTLNSYKIPNTDERALRRYRQFYNVYQSSFSYIAHQLPIRELVSPEFAIKESNSIREVESPELNIPISHYEKMFNTISYSHFVELIRVEDTVKRLFYEIECMKGMWSVAELKRQMGSLLYERAGLSTQTELLLQQTQEENNQTLPENIIKDPYVFEFLGLKSIDVFKEKQLEQSLTDHLLHFLLEMGKGFCFEARQKRIVIDNEHHFIDLVLYHRILHCTVLIELKTEKFHYSHTGQLNLYLEYYKKYEMNEGDNPPIGILLCTDKDAEHVAFATAGLDDKIFVSKYLVELPNKKVLEEFVINQLK